MARTAEQILAKRRSPLPTAKTKDWYRIENKADNSAKVYIYDAIDSWYGVNAKDFVREIDDLDVDEIDLHINSPGGAAFDGIAIMNAIRHHDAKVVATVDGLAASAASIIALGADEVVMAAGAQMMIHNASSIVWGNASEMREIADFLDKLDGDMAKLYAEKGGGDVADWQAAMDAETWYTAQEAVDAGLADRLDKDTEADDPTNRFDLAIFAYAGRAAAPAPQPHKPPAEPAEVTTPSTKGADTMSDKLITGLRERLGVQAEAELDEDGLLAALDEALTEGTVIDAAGSTEGTVVLDEAAYTQLKDDAAAGREARNQQVKDNREQVVAKAINLGRIPPARKDHWISQLEADPGAEAVLNSLPENTVPVEAKGYTGGVDPSSDEDRLYQNAWGSTDTKEA